jgi:hypothetical protein
MSLLSKNSKEVNELRLRRRWEIKYISKIQGVRAWIGFQIRSSDSSYDRGNEPCVSMKVGEYLGQLSSCLIPKGSVPILVIFFPFQK